MASTKKAVSEVGRIIIQQLGGPGKLKAMLGVTSVYEPDHKPGVGFTWPNRQRSKGNACEITLDPDDTYSVRFFNLSGTDKKLVKMYDDVYADSLINIFENQTGWYLRLASQDKVAVDVTESIRNDLFDLIRRSKELVVCLDASGEKLIESSIVQHLQHALNGVKAVSKKVKNCS